MKYILLFVSIISGTYAFSQETVINDRNAELRTVAAFTGIKVSGGIDIYLSQSDDYSLAVSATDTKYRDNIKTEVSNGILEIYYDNYHSVRSNDDKNLRAYISFKTLESIEASGASDVIVSNLLAQNTLLIKLSGASDIKGPVKITDLNLELSGASTVNINGDIQNLKLNASGASDIKDYGLHVENCVAKLSGASDVRITVNGSIAANASGASTLYYEGNPAKKDVATSGASSVSQKNN